ncbi:MAG: L,D-transpeptidase family protein [Thainema sp.]
MDKPLIQPIFNQASRWSTATLVLLLTSVAGTAQAQPAPASLPTSVTPSLAIPAESEAADQADPSENASTLSSSPDPLDQPSTLPLSTLLVPAEVELPSDEQSTLQAVFGERFPDLPTLDHLDQLPDPIAKIELVIRLRDRKVYVYERDQVKATFPIAIGRSGWETPTGEHQVLQMIKDPSWQNPFNGTVIPAGPDNPLGTRWIGFWTDGQNYIGFHGTPNENSVGTAASHGCIRMYNRDVVQLFEMVEVGTVVRVEP